ncbi:hypothetical protein E2493_07810 [Sphingomonas parva]|uniref:Uncharacterized protein n=1 Tax=Sphingomonas parva TaxID=2555898 RepID=A0A4Y8ZRY0_9SPHN|nr:hypothetical protein E2493_07810 [Sphingomonas parva]
MLGLVVGELADAARSVEHHAASAALLLVEALAARLAGRGAADLAAVLGPAALAEVAAGEAGLAALRRLALALHRHVLRLAVAAGAAGAAGVAPVAGGGAAADRFGLGLVHVAAELARAAARLRLLEVAPAHAGVFVVRHRHSPVCSSSTFSARPRSS